MSKHAVLSIAVRDVVEERQRQMDVEGWTLEHDDSHVEGELATCAAVYAVCDEDDEGFIWTTSGRLQWPWSSRWFKPKNRRRNLVRAAALLIAEIERLDRLPAKDEGAR